MTQETKQTYSQRMEQQEQLARKVVDTLRSALTEQEMELLVVTQSMWLAMQMMCGPYRAAAQLQS